MQRIAPAEESPFQLAEHDLRGARRTRAAELRRLVAEEAGAPFDLERGPLIRGRLVRLADDDHVLLVTMHHIVSDGWSMGVLTRELGALYAAFRARRARSASRRCRCSTPTTRRGSGAGWTGEVLQEQAEYWKETLAGAPELLELPTDHPRPARQDFAGGAVGIELDEALTAGLKALGRRHGTTLFMTLLAGWAAVLAPPVGPGRRGGRHAQRPTAGGAEIEGLIGFFVNTLALRVDLSGAPTVAELLARVKARALEAQQHQDIPFEQVVELVQPARSLAHTPALPGDVRLAERARGRAGAAGLALERWAGAARRAAGAQATAKFDLSLALRRGGRADRRARWSTPRRSSSAATVERYAGLPAAGAGGDGGGRRAGAWTGCRCCPRPSARQVLEEWNATERRVSRARRASTSCSRRRRRATPGRGGAWSSRASG